MTTTEIMPPVEVTAATPSPYPFGLFSLPMAATPADSRWQMGVWWQTAACSQVGVTYAPCTVDDDVPAKVGNVVCGIASGIPFTVYAKSDQSTGGAPLTQKFAQARDLLLAGEQWAVERTLWNLLTDATATEDATASTIGAAIAVAEQLIANAYGGTAVMHMSRYAATLAPSEVLKVNGPRLSTFLGASAVAGGGYGTDDFTADPISIIATGGLVVLRGPLFDLGQSIDPQTNRISAVVERNYVVGWDCTAVRVEVGP